MKKEITYIIEKNKVGEIIALYRFWEDEFSHEEIFTNGNWKQNNSLISVLFNLHNLNYEEISGKKAKLIMSGLAPQIESELQTA